MNPNDYYRLKSAEIKEADIRLVAAVMSENAVVTAERRYAEKGAK